VPPASSSFFACRQALLREVYAHAVLQDQPHIVRYHSAWEEQDRMIIQNEYCDRGSLAQQLDNYRTQGRSFTEVELCFVLKHVVSQPFIKAIKVLYPFPSYVLHSALEGWSQTQGYSAYRQKESSPFIPEDWFTWTSSRETFSSRRAMPQSPMQ
jgi:hypothetical protein